MPTAHSYSAAYVKAQQRPEPEAPKPSATYESHCLRRLADLYEAQDEIGTYALETDRSFVTASQAAQ